MKPRVTAVTYTYVHCVAQEVAYRGLTPCSRGHHPLTTTAGPDSAERVPYAKFVRLSSYELRLRERGYILAQD